MQSWWCSKGKKIFSQYCITTSSNIDKANAEFASIA
jgi:hypothetical protein